MYALVFWVKTKETEIIEKSIVPKEANVGETHRFIYKGKKYTAKILKFSEDRAYLDCLEVSISGDIMGIKNKKIKNKEKKQQRSLREKEREVLTKLDERCTEKTSIAEKSPTPKEKEDLGFEDNHEDDYNLLLSGQSSSSLAAGNKIPSISADRKHADKRGSEPLSLNEDRAHLDCLEVSKSGDIMDTENKEKKQQRSLREKEKEVLTKLDKTCTEKTSNDEKSPTPKEKEDLGFEDNLENDFNLLLSGQSSSSLAAANEIPSISADRKHADKRRSELYSLEVSSENVVPLMKKIVIYLEKKLENVPASPTTSRRPTTSRGRFSPDVSPGPSTSSRRQNTVTQQVKTDKYNNNKVEMVEIQPQSGVLVSKDYLKLEVKKFRLRPSEMVRRLMLYLVGAEPLKTMTARGSKSKKGIPADIFDAVKYYVDRNGSPTLPEAMYTRIINQQCGTLRAPKQVKEKKTDNEEVSKTDEEIEDED